MKNCIIIGISDRREQWFPPEVVTAIANKRVFSGGKRHHEIMEKWLPEDAVWIDITVPLSGVFAQYEAYNDIVIFASGDPLFFGFANTVMRELPECKVEVIPSFNSLQMLAHRMCLPYHDMHVVSLTGRPWAKFDEALINGEPLIGVLTDRKHTPHAILDRMHQYGYDNYTMTVGENLGNEEKERIYRMENGEWKIQMENGEWKMENAIRNKGNFYSPFSTVHSPFEGDSPFSTLHSPFEGDSPFSTVHSPFEFAVPNCIILQRTAVRPRPFGIPESDFALLNGRAKMITKMPIRLLSLAMLDLRRRQSLWDVGFCTGSVSIEAKLQFPHLEVTSFEVREEGRELMAENSRRFGTPGINAFIGDFLAQDVSELKKPDAVFIGGHGGKLGEFIKKLHDVMNPGCCIVFNSVSEDSKKAFIDGVEAVGMKITDSTRIAVDDHNPIYILKAE